MASAVMGVPIRHARIASKRTTAEERSVRCLFADGSLIASSRNEQLRTALFDPHATPGQGVRAGSAGSGSVTCREAKTVSIVSRSHSSRSAYKTNCNPLPGDLAKDM